MTSDARTPQRAPLGTWPTPLEPAPRLARALGLGPDDLWGKRDDLTGLGGGGNKIRKLEWLCGAALSEGATTLVTTGAPQSNHARLTAAAAARLGLGAVLVLAGAPGSSASGNLALDGSSARGSSGRVPPEEMRSPPRRLRWRSGCGAGARCRRCSPSAVRA
ncbi:pyridoxal-phosphate dependent enzyme [Streptomyces sp. NBC_00320]|uniref:pyridoxal-phosphate dependent enzyme n=1 Tax=Streptomyces sp. NBC_00320 TaxID=2975711 RepID=UPI002B1DB8AF|nr:pyridoxal-phosphate dependent enzyme [Streptomyces sp. NBC_00320]